MVDPSTLTRFRSRLGEDGVRGIFDRLVAQAREKGLVKDNLRLKDSTHVIANVAIPSALGLFAQLRNRMLKEIEAWDSEQAASFRLELQTVRQETETQDDTIKLSSRVAMVTDLLEWMRRVPQPQVTGQPQVDRKAVERWARLQKTIELAEASMVIIMMDSCWIL
jgi:cellulase/cellobiase CelA1